MIQIFLCMLYGPKQAQKTNMFAWNLYLTWFINLQKKTCINQE
jgi:hypothetical protein